MNQEIQSATYESLCALIDQIAPTTSQKSVDIPHPVAQPVFDMSFNLTKPIQDKLDLLAPTLVLTDYEPITLSPEEIKALVPVPDHTIHQLLILLAGKGTTPYMLDGSLLAHTADGVYIKIIPVINEDGYARYTFNAVNYQLLNRRINRYCKLLQKQLPGFKALLDFFNSPTLTASDLSDACGKDEEFEPFSSTSSKFFQSSKNPLESIFEKALEGDEDASTLNDLYPMLKARTLSTWHHIECRTALERLASTKSMYNEDKELLEDLKHTVKRVYRQRKKCYYVPFIQHYDPPYRISAHKLSAWVYMREDYTKYITNGDYHVDHIQQGVEFRSDNRPENLQIVPADYNTGRTSRSVKTHYNGINYVSLSAFCRAMDVDNYDYLQKQVLQLNPGGSFEVDKYIYTLCAKKQLHVTDGKTESLPPVLFNGKPYASLAAFAKAVKISYNSLQNATSAAKKDGNIEFERKFNNKRYHFYLNENGTTEITS
jgi:hypothetical protein